MWPLIRSEYRYNLGFVAAMPVLVMLMVYNTLYEPIEDLPSGLLFVNFSFIAILNWMALRNKAHRERQWGACPVAAWRRGLARASIWVGMGIWCLALYYGPLALLAPEKLSANMLAPMGLLLTLIGFSYLIRDVVLDSLRNNRFFTLTPERSKAILVGLILGINLLGVVAFMVPGIAKAWIIPVVRAIVHHWLMTTARGGLILMGVAVALAVLSGVSYARKRSFLE